MGLLDLGDYPRINASGLGDCYQLGDGRIRLVLFDWCKIDGVLRRIVAGTVTRPVATLREDYERLAHSPAPCWGSGIRN